MTKQQILEKLDALRGVVDKLPEDAQALNVQISEFGDGVVWARLHLWSPDIRVLADRFEGISVCRNKRQDGDKLSFVAEGVQVHQYEKEL